MSKAAEGGLGWPEGLVGTSLSGFSFRGQALSIPELGALVPGRELGTKVGVDRLSGSPEVGKAGLSNSPDKLSGLPEVGEAGQGNSPDKLSGSPEVGEAGLSSSPEVGDVTSILISALISISEIDGVAEAAGLSSEVGDVGLSSSPVFIGDGRGGIGVDEVIVHGLLVLGFSIVGCPRKFLGAIGIFRIGACAKLCKYVDDKGETSITKTKQITTKLANKHPSKHSND